MAEDSLPGLNTLSKTGLTLSMASFGFGMGFAQGGDAIGFMGAGAIGGAASIGGLIASWHQQK
jgi:hypothetical protein